MFLLCIYCIYVSILYMFPLYDCLSVCIFYMYVFYVYIYPSISIFICMFLLCLYLFCIYVVYISFYIYVFSMFIFFYVYVLTGLFTGRQVNRPGRYSRYFGDKSEWGRNARTKSTESAGQSARQNCISAWAHCNVLYPHVSQKHYSLRPPIVLNNFIP